MSGILPIQQPVNFSLGSSKDNECYTAFKEPNMINDSTHTMSSESSLHVFKTSLSLSLKPIQCPRRLYVLFRMQSPSFLVFSRPTRTKHLSCAQTISLELLWSSTTRSIEDPALCLHVPYQECITCSHITTSCATKSLWFRLAKRAGWREHSTFRFASRALISMQGAGARM